MSARLAFIEAAGNTYESTRPYRRWSARDKYDGFWSFYDKRRQGAISIYAGIAVEVLRRESVYSIEHLIPKSFLERGLAHRKRSVRAGASVNPFNFAPCHRRLNQKRDHWPFDLNGDPIMSGPRVPNGGLERSFGFDKDREWVVPPRSRGDIARGILLMALTYGLGGFDAPTIDVYRRWAREDPPSNLERDFNRWVEGRLAIRNPLIRDESWLDDEDLYRGLAALPVLGAPE